jgi:small multidrug resistance family-3 protein
VGNSLALVVLLVAAMLEAGGDALVRHGLNASTVATRLGFFAIGAIVLFIYGLTVNAPSWDFGRLLGVYVALFFVVAQAINWLVFGSSPTVPIFVGGALIIAGGLTITYWRA